MLILIVPASNSMAAITSQIVLKADTVKYDSNSEAVSASGNIYVSMDQYELRADSLYYDIEKDVLFADGNIRIKDEQGRLIFGQRAILKDRLKNGIIDEFVLKLQDGSILVAANARRNGDKQFSMHKASYTPCKITCNNQPIWQLKSRDTEINYDSEEITYRNVFFEVFGVPVIFSPYFFHSTPNAGGKSGILVPYMNNKTIIVPFYYRAKSNLDFTLSPRAGMSYNIIEAQMRHLVSNGNYTIDGSIGNPQDTKAHKKYLNRYHIFAKGDFSKNNINYGFDLNRTSDKSYLKNYYQFHDSYLESKFYLNKINVTDYFSLESYYFQDLRSNDQEKPLPLIFPRVRNQNIVALNDNETIFLKIKNDALIYNENYEKEVARNALELELTSNIITNNGHLFNFALSNRNDVYWVNINQENSPIINEKIWDRNIPEFSGKWRYPLIRHFSNDISLKLEPIMFGVIGENYNKKFDKFALIDIAKYELSEYNLFKSNRLSGIDYHDFGKRLSYGMNGSLFLDPYYIDTFLGQSIYNNNLTKNSNADYVGNASIDIEHNLKLYYRFRKDKKLKSIRDEVGISTIMDKITANSSFSRLNNISKYYSDDKFNFPENKVTQVNFNVGYQILESLKIDTGVKFDITTKPNLLERTIVVTYVMDCVSITAKLYDSYTHDKNRGIRKNHDLSFSIGLKSLNF